MTDGSMPPGSHLQIGVVAVGVPLSGLRGQVAG